MRRIVILAQPGEFGSAWGCWAANRLAQRLGLPCLSAGEVARETADGRPSTGRSAPWLAADEVAPETGASGWVATSRVGACPEHVLRAADTAVWLHFSPPAVLAAWWRGLRGRLAGAPSPLHAPRLADVRASVVHMAWTPHVQRTLGQPTLAHLRVVHLRDPAQTDFWLRLQELRLRQATAPLGQAA